LNNLMKGTKLKNCFGQPEQGLHMDIGVY
jgi:hypothetical protein